MSTSQTSLHTKLFKAGCVMSLFCLLIFLQYTHVLIIFDSSVQVETMVMVVILVQPF